MEPNHTVPTGKLSVGRRVILTWLMAAMVISGLTAGAPAPRAFAQEPAPLLPGEPAPNAPLDVPETVINEAFRRFAFGGNLLYWEDHCDPPVPLAAVDGGELPASAHPDAIAAASLPAGAVEPDALDSGFIRRKPADSYFSPTTIDVAGSAPDCYTYELFSADVDGVYYFVFGGPNPRIEYRQTGDFATPIIVATVTGPTTPFGARFATDATHVYWAASGGVLRARKDGTSPAPEVMADGLSFPNDILIVGSTLYIVDSDAPNAAQIGVFSIPTTGASSCPETGAPCIEARFSAVGGDKLVYRFVQGITIINSRTEILWVSGESIRRYSCGFIALTCFEDTIYQIPNDGRTWFIGRPSVFQTLIFWHEGYYNGAADRIDRVRRMTVGATPQTIAETAAFTGGNPTAVSGAHVYFHERVGADNRLQRLSLLASPIVRDLKADQLEVTQGIQNLANNVPLTAKKATYVRLYGVSLSGPNANGVQAVLEGRVTSSGAALPGSPLQPLNGTRTLAVGSIWTRENVNSGWLFKLPQSWVNAGGITLRGRLDPKAIYQDPVVANNQIERAVTLSNLPPACAIYVPVRTHNPKPTVDSPNFWDMVARYQRMWPTHSILNYTTGWQAQELQTCWAGIFPYPCGGPFELDQGSSLTNWIPDRDKVIMELWAFNLVNNAPACDDADAYTHIMGMVHPSAATGGVAGYASTISGESWVRLPPASPNPFPDSWTSMIEASVMAQELSHNLGRKHVNCGSPDNVDGSYPYPPCSIANAGQSSYYGFDPKTQVAIGPASARDYMSYDDPAWTSDYTWRAIRNQLTALAAASEPQVAAATLQAGMGLLVSNAGTVVATGHLNADPTTPLGEIESTRVYATGVPSVSMLEKMLEVVVADWSPPHADEAAPSHEEEPDAANFHLRLLAANGTVLADKALSLLPIDDHDPSVSSQVWLASFAAPAGSVARVQLMADNKVLDEVTPGPSTPVVALQQPAAGITAGDSLTVQWTAGDADGDPLSFILQYSHDNGATWQALDSNVPGGPGSTYQIVFTDLSMFHGSAPNAARVRVIANDGYNTTVATSGGFTLSDRKPRAAILSPAPGSLFDPQLAVNLEGNGTDAEDGLLSDAQLTWRLNGAVVGNGTSPPLTGVAPGSYPVLLEVRDTLNQLGSATSTLNVAPLSVPQAGGAVLDGACDDSNYAKASQITLKPYGTGADGAGSLRIMHDGTSLWACFSGLKRGNESPGASVGLRFDVNNSRDALAQPSDYGFFVQENGGYFTRSGDGGGGIASTGPGGLQAQVTGDAVSNTWSAEMRITGSVLGGFNKIVGMMVGHHDVMAANDDFVWPYAISTVGVGNAPNTWARTVLGLQPIIRAVDPISATVGGPDLVLTVEGDNIAPGAQLLWNGTPLPSSVASTSLPLSPQAAQELELERQLVAAGEIPALTDGIFAVQASTTISAVVSSSLLAAAGPASLTVENPGPLQSPSVAISVNNKVPQVTTLSPPSRTAGTPAFVLTVNGANFVSGAKVVWDGVELPTTFVSAGQVTAQVAAAQVAQGVSGEGEGVGVLVRNPVPAQADSNAVAFLIVPSPGAGGGAIYLPTVRK